MPKIIITSEVFTLDEAAREIDIGIATLYRWMSAGRVTVLRLDHRTYITKDEVERLKQLRQ